MTPLLGALRHRTLTLIKATSLYPALTACRSHAIARSASAAASLAAAAERSVARRTAAVTARQTAALYRLASSVRC
jgi:hypothetical protein